MANNTFSPMAIDAIGEAMNISGRRWFDGRMGIYNKQMAVKIGETYIKA